MKFLFRQIFNSYCLTERAHCNQTVIIVPATSFGGDFSDFLTRDPFFTSMQTPSPRLNNISNNAFPPIGTFTLESTTPQSNQMFPPPSDFYNSSNHSNSSHMNGTVGNSGNSSNASSIFNSTNNNGGDPNQATRETGIIEKLLVCSIH